MDFGMVKMNLNYFLTFEDLSEFASLSMTSQLWCAKNPST